MARAFKFLLTFKPTRRAPEMRADRGDRVEPIAVAEEPELGVEARPRVDEMYPSAGEMGATRGNQMQQRTATGFAQMPRRVDDVGQK